MMVMVGVGGVGGVGKGMPRGVSVSCSSEEGIIHAGPQSLQSTRDSFSVLIGMGDVNGRQGFRAVILVS